jgi:predicted translin family RNA/ssDNA-binding protein
MYTHRIQKDNREQTLKEAEEKLATIRVVLHEVAKILQGHPQLQYARAFSPGAPAYLESSPGLLPPISLRAAC